MTDIISISKDLRVRDYDESNYVLEVQKVVKDGKHAGSTRWAIIAYCGTVKGLVSAVREKFIVEAVIEAKTAAISKFEQDGIEIQLHGKLQDKGKKREEAA